MSNFLSHSIIVRHESETSVTPLRLLVFLALSLGAVVWGATSILGSQGLQFQRYLALLAFYAAASAVFVMSRIRRGRLQLFEIPVYITCIFFLQFGLLPLGNFTDPRRIDWRLSANGEELVVALSYCILGMMAFWMGCQAARRKQSGQMPSGLSEEETSHGPREGRIMLFAIVLFGVAFATRFFLLRAHLYSFLGSVEKSYANLASMQVLSFLSQLGTMALVVACIERYRNRSDPTWKLLFAVIFSSEVLWGFFSGMKAAVVINFLAVAVVSSLVRQRLNLRWVVLPLLVLILLYPVSEAYRGVVTQRHAEEITSFQGAGRASRVAFQDATQMATRQGGLWQFGLVLTQHRLELLTCVAWILRLSPQARSFVRGNLPWWMVPIYPFVPRLFWPSKPILVEGQRFTIALGALRASQITNGVSSTSVTYPGDLYLQFGLLGIPVGMFLLGLVAQWFTNRVSGPIGGRDLFVYACVLLLSFNPETDVFSVWSSLIKLLAILSVVSWVIYGPRRRPRRVVASHPVLARQL